ncbi:MAG: leucyl/phenylalanyl-tRNA--protein transferase [Salinisphaeraceae bacterium]|nr:leucyl/phenylalanyl-tRNA--protein transferase [Salinisphaeraceae bacterium]
MLPLIRAHDPPDYFPPVEHALDEPNGLLAAGGDLSPQRLLAAYTRGIFPWYSEGDPILWWSPDPRTVFKVGELHISRRLARTLRQTPLRITFNQSFAAVIQACAKPRRNKQGNQDADTWLTPEMQTAYIHLHELGHAQSVEVWKDNQLVGGLYGLPIGRVFCAESMFSKVSDASKIALYHLDQWLQEKSYYYIDAQVGSGHLYRMGARDIPRSELIPYLSPEQNVSNLMR